MAEKTVLMYYAVQAESTIFLLQTKFIVMTANFLTKLFNLSGKCAIVTGSGYGLGHHMAIGLADAGANVIVCGRNKQKLDDTVVEIEKRGGIGFAHVFDATDKIQCDALVAAAVSRYQKLDMMVINHGVIAVNTPEATTSEQWRHTVDVNLTSCFYCAQAAGTQMIKQGQGGSIVITSSNGSLVSFDGLSAYGASKGGVDQLCRQLAAEWGQYKIRVNTVNPGYTENPMGGRPQEKISEPFEKEIRQRTPLGRRGKVEEFIGPVLFLGSDASSFVTGHALTVDGGYSIV